MFRKELRGTGVALVTPFKEDFSIDYTALGGLIDFNIAGGVEYVVALGTTAETPTLTKEEKIKILDYTYDRVNGRVPVVVGVGGNSTLAVIEEIHALPLGRAVAVLSASPYYNRPSQEGIFQHYKAVAEASPLPILLYNVPARTGSNMTAATTLRLAKEVPNIVGVKEASGLMVQCMHILRDRPEGFLFVSGDDHVTLPLVACGADGVISVAANVFPGDFSELVRLALTGDFAGAQVLQFKLLEGFDLLFAENNPAGVKAILAELGLIGNVLRLPLVPLSAGVHMQVKAYLGK